MPVNDVLTFKVKPQPLCPDQTGRRALMPLCYNQPGINSGQTSSDGQLTQTIAMQEEQLQESVATFDAAADAYLKHFRDYPAYQPSYEAFLEALLPEQKHILELGCGPGQVSHYLLTANPELNIMGLDLAPNMVRLARELNPDAEFRVMDIREAGSLHQRFDAVFAGFCLPYLQPSAVSELLAGLPGLMNPAGLVYLSLTTGPGDQLIKQTSPNAPGAVYLYHHDLSAIRQQLEDNSFTIIKSATMHHEHHQQDLTDVYLLARLLC
jgi:SAM-dependent methyltransferase